MFRSFIYVCARSPKWLPYPSNRIISLLIVEKHHIVDTWITDLSHSYISIYLDGVCSTIHHSGMLKWRSWEYSFYWWKIKGGIKNFTLCQLKTSNVHKNGACYPFCTLLISPPRITYKYKWTCSTFHWYQTQFHHISAPDWILAESYWVQRIVHI